MITNKALAILIIGLLLSLLALQTTEICKAQQSKPYPYPGIELSIENDSTYTSSSVPLYFTGTPIPWATVTYSNFTGYLDGNIIVLNSSENTLTGLSNGQHNIRITASVSVRFYGSQQSEFYAKYGFFETIHVMELKSVDTGLINFNIEEPAQLTPTPSSTISKPPVTTAPTPAPTSSPTPTYTPNPSPTTEQTLSPQPTQTVSPTEILTPTPTQTQSSVPTSTPTHPTDIISPPPTNSPSKTSTAEPTASMTTNGSARGPNGFWIAIVIAVLVAAALLALVLPKRKR
ncbi:MAG: hypothetical protein NWF05_12150 [Candidatus Bathyarchaeota archaeon]|nr:hypothetical protein [Candidatus Bathyarchaeota archaeon]